jgi:hypothetical protein
MDLEASAKSMMMKLMKMNTMILIKDQQPDKACKTWLILETMVWVLTGPKFTRMVLK